MIKPEIAILAIISLNLALPGCAAEQAAIPVACADLDPTRCEALGTTICARRDTGRRCIRAPCDSVEYVSATTACGICDDEKVDMVFPGSCDDFKQYLESAPMAPETQ